MRMYRICLFFITAWICWGFTNAANSLFELNADDLEGREISLSRFESAKVIIVVNVASNCAHAYTHYNELVEIYDRLKDKGLEILAFPR